MKKTTRSSRKLEKEEKLEGIHHKSSK